MLPDIITRVRDMQKSDIITMRAKCAEGKLKKGMDEHDQ